MEKSRQTRKCLPAFLTYLPPSSALNWGLFIRHYEKNVRLSRTRASSAAFSDSGRNAARAAFSSSVLSSVAVIPSRSLARTYYPARVVPETVVLSVFRVTGIP